MTASVQLPEFQDAGIFDDDALEPTEHAINYMANVWLPEGRCYVLRRNGSGENVLRAGDLVEEILQGSFVPPAGPLWVPSYRYRQLAPDVIAQLLARGVTDVRQIPETVGNPPEGFCLSRLRQYEGAA